MNVLYVDENGYEELLENARGWGRGLGGGKIINREYSNNVFIIDV